MANYARGTKTGDDTALQNVREAFDYGTEHWKDIRAAGREDIKYVSGDPWSAKDRKAREDAGRPCLSLDELSQYTNQLINEVRQHKRAINVAPLGNGANDALARVRADLIRQIEYRSNAQIAYTTGFENTVQRSYGFWRIKARYESPRSFNQELFIDPIPNPDMVTPDPDLLQPDGSDIKFCFIHERWRITDFKKRWPKAQVRDFSSDLQQEAPKWIDDKTIQIAEYWCIEEETRQLLLVQGPQGPTAVFFDELQPPKDGQPESAQRWEMKFRPLIGAVVLQNREVAYPQVTMRLTNGFEFLPNEDGSTVTRWRGRHIPVVCCFGKVLYVDEGGGSKRRMLSLVRLARDPYMLYCYYRTCEAELVGMTPKFPYFAYEGQLSDVQETALAKSLHEPVALIKIRAITDEVPTGPLPFPQRQPYDPPIQALEVGAESARRAIQAAMGMSPLPTSAQRYNEKSGIALKRIEDSAQKGALHFIDHYEMAITRTGVILDDLLDHYYDAARDVTLRTASGETRVRRLNDPQAVDAEAQQPLMMGQGEFDITLSTGPSYDSEREAASEFADALLTSGLPQAQAILPLVVKLKNLGPIGDEIVEVLLALSPPPVQAILKKDQAGQPTTADLIQQLQQAQQLTDALSQELNEKNKLLETEQIKAQQQVEIAQVKANTEAQVTLAELQATFAQSMRELEVKLEIELAKIGSALAMQRGELEMEELHAHDQRTLAREAQEAAALNADLDRQAAREAQTAQVAPAAPPGVSSEPL